jgi:hypothetical protein
MPHKPYLPGQHTLILHLKFWPAGPCTLRPAELTLTMYVVAMIGFANPATKLVSKTVVLPGAISPVHICVRSWSPSGESDHVCLVLPTTLLVLPKNGLLL